MYNYIILKIHITSLNEVLNCVNLFKFSINYLKQLRIHRHLLLNIKLRNLIYTMHGNGSLVASEQSPTDNLILEKKYLRNTANYWAHG